jgi:signal transduction histidine kinase
VLSNLVDNALRHGAGTVSLSAAEADDGVALSVRDEGPGFPEGLEPFERFSRGDAARTRGGAGLGLALVRVIAEAHGGRAEVDGAGVRVWLPSG